MASAARRSPSTGREAFRSLCCRLRVSLFRTLSVSTNKVHQSVSSRTAVEHGSPPSVAVPRHTSIGQPEPPRLRGLADAMHPSEDGKPMAWSSRQARAIIDVEYVMRFRYAPRDDVYVSFDQLVYYSEGPWPKSVVPNVFVSFGVPSYPREVYRVEEEGKPPDWVLEVASPKTFRYNVGGKKDLYEEIGVGEYWVYDPHGDLHDPRLRGWVLRPGGYEELADLERLGVPVALRSEALSLELHFDGADLRLWDPAKSRNLRTIDEAERRGDIAEAKREALAREPAAVQPTRQVV